MILRIFFLFLSFITFVLFLGAVTYDTGKSSIYPFIIPIIGSIATILILSKLEKEYWIKVLPFILITIGLLIDEGFINYTIIGLSSFLFFFNAIRPWKD